MDYHGLQARLADLKRAEMAALRRGDTKAAERCREKQFALRHWWTNEQGRHYRNAENRLSKDAESNESQGEECIGTAEEEDIDLDVANHLSRDAGGEESQEEEDSETAEEEDDLFSTYAESEENQEEEDPGTAEEEDTREEKDKESYSDGSEEEEATCKKAGKREKKPCPLPQCNAKVVHLPKHLRNVHNWQKEYARTALSRFKLRKKYKFASQETASAGNRRAKPKPKPKESTSCKNPHRKRKLCPLLGCMVSTERLPQHLQRKHKLKRDDAEYKKALSMAKVVSAKRSHVFLRMKEERNKATNPESNFTLEDKEFTNDHENSEDEHSMHSKAPDHGDEGGEHPMHSKAPDHGDEGSEHSMHSKAPDRGDEGGGSDVFATENDLPETAGPAITKTKDLGSESKILGEFSDWLLSPDGEQKDKKTAHQHWSQLKRVISITSGGLSSLVDAKVIRDVFLRYATETYCPATIKSYLMSLQHYCSFLLEDKPSGVDYDKDDVTALRVKLKKWSASYKRSGTRRRWEKQEEDLSCLITPEKVNEFDQSQAARDAIIIIGRLCGAHSIEITQAMYTLVRDYLIAQIMIDNANRAGVVAYMTVEEFKRASMEDDRHVVRVLHHKTVDTHGPSVVVLTAHLYNHLKVFFEEMRSKLPLPDDRLEGKQPMFLSWNGKRLQSSQVTRALGSVFKKAGVEGRVHHTLYRKSAVTQCHDKHKEIASHLADLMAHRESTAEKYYRVFDKNKSSVKASQTLHGMMRNTKSKSPIVRVEESEEGVDKFAENKDVQGDSATTSRSPWDEDSIEALRTLFKEEISAQSVSMTCVRDKIESNPVLCLEDPKRVYDKVRAEWRYKGNTDSIMELTKLPEETETVNHRVDRMFASNNENTADNSSSRSTDFVSATDTTVKSKGLFSNSQAKDLVELFPDMVNDGKPISKPVIIKRLSECSKGDLFKDYNVAQVVNRIKYERRQKREREQSRKVGVNKLT